MLRSPVFHPSNPGAFIGALRPQPLHIHIFPFSGQKALQIVHFNAFNSLPTDLIPIEKNFQYWHGTDPNAG